MLTKARVEAFSDGVLAIAITLLVIELRSPEAEKGELAEALRNQWPHYAAYFVSFAVLGVIWLNHHRIFEQVRAVDGPLLLLNLHLLLWAALIPFPTAVVADHLGEGGADAKTAVGLYGIVILATAIGFVALHGWVTHDERIAGDLPDPSTIRRVRVRFGIGLLFYTIALGLAWISPRLALATHGAMALYYAFDQASATTADDNEAA